MKLRLIQKGPLFIPQYFSSRDSWNRRWVGFGSPNVKFADKSSAMQFLQIIHKFSIKQYSQDNSTQVIWTNVAEKK